MEGNNNVSDRRVAYRGVAQNWVYKCTLCPRTFTTSQGLAGHMNGHRFDEGYQKGSSHLRLPYNHAAEFARFSGVDFRTPPSVSPFPVTFRPPLGATRAMHGHAHAVQPDFGGTALVASTVPPSPLANNLGFARVLARSQSSSERTVTDLNPKVSDDEEEVSSKARIEIDTELKLGRG